MPGKNPRSNHKKPPKREQTDQSSGGGQDRQTGGYQQDPTQKGDRERGSV